MSDSVWKYVTYILLFFGWTMFILSVIMGSPAMKLGIVTILCTALSVYIGGQDEEELRIRIELTYMQVFIILLSVMAIGLGFSIWSLTR